MIKIDLILSQYNIVPDDPADVTKKERDAEIVVHDDSTTSESRDEAEDWDWDEKKEDWKTQPSYWHMIHRHP